MRRNWVVAIFWFVVLDAMAMQARGPLLASFEAEFGVSEGLLGLVAPAGTLGFVVAVLVVGFVAGRVDLRKTLLLGTIGTAGALAVMASAPVYWLFLTALLAQGTATGAFRGIDRAMLSHIYPDRRGRIFALYALAWALGAVAGPLVVSAVLRTADWRVTFLLLALGFLPIVALLWRPPVPERAANEQPLSMAALGALLRTPAIVGTIVAMALVGGIEGAIFTWLPYYADSFLERTLANLALSAFLLGYVPGRLAYARLVERVPYLVLVGAITATAVPVLAWTLTRATGWQLLGGAFVAGVLVSGLFPSLSAYGVDTAPAYSGPVSALATAATYVGIATVPVGMGLLAETTTIATAMLVPVVLAVVLLAVLIGTRLWTGTAHAPD